MTRCRVENLSDRPQILHRHFFYINTEFETGGAGIWKKKLNLGTPNGHIGGSFWVTMDTCGGAEMQKGASGASDARVKISQLG